MAEKTTRIQYPLLDIARLVFAICVVAIHTTPLAPQNPLFAGAYDLFLRLAVPVFFAAGGFLLVRGLPGKLSDPENCRRVGKAACSVGLLYLTWHLIFLPASIYGLWGLPLKDAVLEYLRNLFLVGEQFYSWPLWYLLATFYSLGALWLVLKCKGNALWFGLVGAVGFALSFFVTKAIAQDGWGQPFWQTLAWDLHRWFINGRLFSGVGYVAAGVLLARCPKKLPLWTAALLAAGGFVASALLWKNGVHLSETPWLMLPSVGVLRLLLCLETETAHPLCIACRRASHVIYFVHMLFYILAGLTLFPFGEEAHSGPAVFGFVLALSCLTALPVICTKPNPVSKFLFKG